MTAFLKSFKSLFASRTDDAQARQIAELQAVIRRQSEALQCLAGQVRELTEQQDEDRHDVNLVVGTLRREQAEAVQSLNAFWTGETGAVARSVDRLLQGYKKRIDELEAQVSSLASDLVDAEDGIGSLEDRFDEISSCNFDDHASRLEAVEEAVERIEGNLEDSASAADQLIAARLVKALRQAADKIEQL